MIYECFSILCNAFLLKNAISSHNSWVKQLYLPNQTKLISYDADGVH